MSDAQALPLAGVRVLDFTNAVAGTSCTAYLGDWGAEVIRIESIRHWQPGARGFQARPSREVVARQHNWTFCYPDWEPGEQPWNRSAVFHSSSRSKLSMTVDLSRPDGQAIMQQLVACADVFVENNSPDVPERLHLTYDELRAVRPDLIMLQMPAYGSTGPHRHYRSYGSQLEGVVGHTAMRGYADTEPTTTEATFVSDAAGGIAGAFAVMLALRHRLRTGEGQRLESALTENFLTWMGESLLDYQVNGRLRTPRGNRSARFAPYGVYPARGEDRWIAICINTTAQWQTLVHLIDAPVLRRDELQRVDRRLACHDEIDAGIAAWTSGLDARALMQLLQSKGVPAGRVQDAAEICADEQLRARGFFQPLHNEETGDYEYPGLHFQLEGTPNALRLSAPSLGEHNRLVYQDLLGCSEAQLQRLEQEQHIGTAYIPGIL